MGKLISNIRGLMSKILIIIAVILIALAIIYAGENPLRIYGFDLTPLTMTFLAAVSLGLAFLIDSKTAGETLAKVTNGAKQVVAAAGSIMGQAVKTTGEVATTALSAFIWPIMIVGGGYLIYKDIKDDN